MNRTSSRTAMLAASLIGLGGIVGGVAGGISSPSMLEQTKVGTTSNQATRGTQTRAADPASNPSRLGERNAIAKAMFGNFGRYKPARFPNGPGWTHAHVQRMARKRRNKARNRKAHR